jgi:hypothetical protein
MGKCVPGSNNATISKGSGLRAQGSGLRAQGSGLRAQGSGLRAQGFIPLPKENRPGKAQAKIRKKN